MSTKSSHVPGVSHIFTVKTCEPGGTVNVLNPPVASRPSRSPSITRHAVRAEYSSVSFSRKIVTFARPSRTTELAGCSGYGRPFAAQALSDNATIAIDRFLMDELPLSFAFRTRCRHAKQDEVNST